MKKEEKKAREAARRVALHDLSATTTYSDLATAYLASKNKNFGEYDQNLIEQGVYLPALGKSNPMMVKLLMESRKDGDRYSGQIDESAIIQGANEHIQSRILDLKVSDIAKYLGAEKGKQYAKIKNQYVRDLDQETQSKLLSLDIDYMVRSKLANAMVASTKELGKHGLETILSNGDDLENISKGAQ